MKHLVIFSGAGMSAESGIATFRGAGGLWEGYSIDEVATPEAWHADPDRVTRFYNMRRQNVMDAIPNAGHQIIADLEKHYEVDVITQNIDDLHERAGSTRVMHLHGEIMKIQSSLNPSYIKTIDRAEVTANDRCPNGSRMRPNVVWFGEAVPMIEPASRIVSRADIFVVVGTSLQVYPAAGLVSFTKPEAKVYVVDPNAGGLPAGLDGVRINKGAVEGLRDVRELLLEGE